MRFGLIPESFTEWLALRSGRVPIPLADTQIALLMARTVMEASRLGIFEVLADGPRSAEAVAEVSGTHPAATQKLLDALAGIRYLRPEAGGYALAAPARRWLLAESPAPLGDKLRMQFDEWELIERIGSYVETGEPQDFHADMDEAAWGRYQRGMRAVARVSAPEVARRTPVPSDARTLLDVGGAHGCYAAALCRRHPRLRAVVLDLPQAVQAAAPLLAKEGLGDRLEHRCGDARTADLGEGAWDVVLVSSLAHHFSEEENRALARRGALALRPGGVLVLQEYARPTSPQEAARASLGALLDLFFATTSRSGTWTLGEMAAWQVAAGLQPLPPQWLRTIPGHVQQAATKPEGYERTP